MRLRDVLTLRIDRETRRDVARVSLQTMVASGATYALLTAMDWSDVSWGVISAIFVIQLNSDASVASGLGRIAGTVMGTIFGLAASEIFSGYDGVLARVAITTALASGIATIWPRLNYGAVAAAAIVVQAHPELSDAISMAVAIAIGAIVGTASTLLVWPELGRTRVLRMLEYALSDCRAYLDQVLAGQGKADRQNRQAVHENFVGHMATARSVLQDTQFGARLQNGHPLRDLLGAVDRLWYGLVLLERAIGHERIDLTKADQAYLKGHVTDVQREARKFLEKMVDYLQKGRSFPQLDTLQETIADARDAAEGRLQDMQESQLPGRTIRVLLFALEEVSSNLSDLQALAKAPEDRRS